MMDDLICKKHKIEKECLAGCGAHPDNWYCPECEKEKINFTSSSSNQKEVTPENILDAVKLIAALKAPDVEPYSLGNIGGVRIISSPHIADGSIVVSNDIWLLLQDLSNN